VCGIFGHGALTCRNRFNHAYQQEDYHGGNSATTGHYDIDPNWYMDTGATDHLTSDLDRLSVPGRYHGKDQVQVANGAGLPISHIGHSIISGSNRPLVLKNVLHVPRISKHLLSVYKLVSQNDVFIEFHRNSFFVKDKATRKIILQGRSRGGLYPVPIRRSSSSPPVSIHHASASTKVSPHDWHRRLGHPTPTVVNNILKSNKILCSSSQESLVCDACQRAKSHQLPYNKSIRITTSPLELIHSDVWGPARASVGGFKYYVSFLDDYSHYTCIYLIKRKSDVEQVFYNFQAHVERLLQTKIRAIQSDWGGEYYRLHRYF
jgi:histone deacetylase 1/2